jgi:hypothetical protein
MYQDAKVKTTLRLGHLGPTMLLLVIVVGGAISGCSLFGQRDQFGNVQVTNSTDVAIDVVFQAAGQTSERVLRHIDAHKTDTFDAFAEGCSTQGVLIARAPDGHEIVRLNGPFCQQMTWTVTATQSS